MLQSVPAINKNKTSDNLINDYESTNLKLNNEMDTIITAIEYASQGHPISNQYNIGFETINLEKGKDILIKIGTLEDNIEETSQKVLSYKLNYDVSNDIDRMYNSIISSINKCIKEDYDFTFSLSTEESKYFSSEILSILKQTLNTNNNIISSSIKNLYNLNSRFQNIEDRIESPKKRKNNKKEDELDSIEIK